MGLRGPAKTPLELVQRRGNPGHRPVNRRAPQPAKKRPTPSRGIKADPAVWKHFKELVRRTEQLGVLRQTDGLAIEKLAQLEADWDETTRMIRESGFLIQNPQTDMVHLNPLLRRQEALLIQLMRGYREFGFTPSARANLRTEAEAPTENPWDEF